MRARLSVAGTPGGECLPPPGTRHLHSAAMKLRLIEQACGCSTVQGGGGLNVRARLSAAGTRLKSACWQDHAPAECFAFATEPPR